MHNVHIKVAQRMWVSFRLFMKRPGEVAGMGEVTRMRGGGEGNSKHADRKLSPK